MTDQDWFGRCPCGGRYATRTVSVQASGTRTIDDVEQGSCPLCGSRIYKTSIVEMLELNMRDQLPADDRS
jgi:hypothetical protein